MCLFLLFSQSRWCGGISFHRHHGRTHTVLNDHIGQSHTAADVAIQAANGEEMNAYYWVDYVKVTAENAAEFMTAE